MQLNFVIWFPPALSLQKLKVFVFSRLLEVKEQGMIKQPVFGFAPLSHVQVSPIQPGPVRSVKRNMQPQEVNHTNLENWFGQQFLCSLH